MQYSIGLATTFEFHEIYKQRLTRDCPQTRKSTAKSRNFFAMLIGQKTGKQELVRELVNWFTLQNNLLQKKNTPWLQTVVVG